MERVWAEEWGERSQQEGTHKPRFQMAKEKTYLWFSALRINDPSLELVKTSIQRNLVLILRTTGGDGRWLFLLLFVFEQKNRTKVELQRLDLGAVGRAPERGPEQADADCSV